ncbi:MAG: UDP-N-acetylmuramoyl-L-alanyl-D-glutamate--2,6-diaminopimelate ligase [Candidatus Omnitrophica bacterium]|nr:UDP-N-acetylmuramoyl-L-alanyl-D-glutamate--2,6-diaminopimelate ligase [Candidatus Omnitrophota bacterium]
MRLCQLLQSLDTYKAAVPVRDVPVKGITAYSKDVKPGFVFVALKGAQANGSDFIRDALKRGAGVIISESEAPVFLKNEKVQFIRIKNGRKAVGCLARAFFGNPSKKIKITGITGTNGKTTISYLIEALLKKNGNIPGIIGTVNYRFKNTVIVSHNTTPGPVELQAMLKRMSDEGVDHVAMEVSSHALDQERTVGIDFSSCIFTNLTQDHLDYHGTLENYFQAKVKLFRNARPGAYAIINNDDPYGMRLRRLSSFRVFTYGIEHKADFMAKDIRMDLEGTEFIFVLPRNEIRIKTKLIGRHNVYNVLAAAAWALREGVDIEIIRSVFASFPNVPGRMEHLETRRDFRVFVDYAHTEDALRNVISTLRQICKNRIIVVFGCGGDRDKSKRPKMGRIVSTLADFAVITNDNPRSESPRSIIGDIRKGISRKNYCVIPDRFEAIEKALYLAAPGDVVLVAGKGHENYQIIKDQMIYFDDREVVRECLKLMS